MKLPVASLISALLFLSAISFALPSVEDSPPHENEWGFRPSNDEIVKRTPAPFVWMEQASAATYELEYSRDPEFRNEVIKVHDLKWNVHCPSQVMPTGTWYWRMRYIDNAGQCSDWSKIRRFEISADASADPMPSKKELSSRAPQQHPRIFLRPEDIQTLREKCRGDLKDEYAELVCECDKLLRDPPSTIEPLPYPPDVKRPSKAWLRIWWGNRVKVINALGGAATLGFGYQLTGKKEYGELAKKILLECAKWNPRGATSRPYNDEAGIPYISRFSRTYSFINDLLSKEEKETCRNVIKVRGNEAFKFLYPHHFYHPYDSHSNRLWHFLGEAGLVFLNEIPEAEDWLWGAMNIYYCVYPVWGDDDGGWHEGLWYWWQYQERFLWWADIMKSAFDIDIAKRKFYSQTGYFAMYVQPPNTNDGGFSDFSARCRMQHGHVMAALASITQNPYWKWYSDQMAPFEKEDIYIVLMRKSRSAVKPLSPEKLPTSRCFPGNGLACLNTDLTDGRKNVQILFKSSPSSGTTSHGYDANNSFLLNAFGERLLIRSGARDCYASDFHSNWMWDTKSENNITVDGKSQLKHSREARGRITAFSTGNEFDYVAGEAANSYEGRLKSFKRQILFCKPSAILIVDTLEAAQTSSFEWHMHSCNPMKINGQNDIRIINGNASCQVDFLYPSGLHLEQTNKFDPPIPEHVAVTQYHLTANLQQKSKNACFITLLRPYRSGQDNAIKKVEFTETPQEMHVLIPSKDKTLDIRISRQDSTITVEAGSTQVFPEKH